MTRPAQLTREDLVGMSPEAIMQARADGRLDVLLGVPDPDSCHACGRPLTDPPPTAA